MPQTEKVEDSVSENTDDQSDAGLSEIEASNAHEAENNLDEHQNIEIEKVDYKELSLDMLVISFETL